MALQLFDLSTYSIKRLFGSERGLPVQVLAVVACPATALLG
jgi:hypothetical protein